MEGSKNARERRASLDDAESDLMASSSSLFSELSWEGDCDRETVARHLGMTGKSLQDYLEYQKKDDTSSLPSASTTKCADDIDSSSADGAGSSPGSGHRMRHRASIRGSIVSLSGTVLESIQECDRSSDEDTALQSKGANVTFVKFEPSADDASDDYGSEESLRVDELFDAAGSDGDANAKSSTGVNEGVSKAREEEVEDDDDDDDDDDEGSLNAADAAVVSRNFHQFADTIGSSSTRSIKGSTSRSSSIKSRPDPPESPRIASKAKAMNDSAASLHIDVMRQVPVVSKTEKRAASSRAKPFEITAVFVPQDVADDVVSGIYGLAAGSSEANLGLQTSADNNATTNALARSSLRSSQDSEGKIISTKINELKNKLTEASGGNASSISEPSNASEKSLSSDASSVLINIVKDVKLELANINMQVDEYRMKQRHLYEENELLAKQKDRLENQLESATKNCDTLQYELKGAKKTIRSERKTLHESKVAEKQLRLVLEECQSRLAEATRSEQQANLAMMNMMHHKNTSATMEFLDFTPDIEMLRGDEGTTRTEDLTDQVNSKSSLLSSMASNLSADEAVHSFTPERGLFRRLSNMFSNPTDNKNIARSTEEEQQVAASLANNDSTEIPLDPSECRPTSTPSETVAARPPATCHSSRRYSGEPPSSRKSDFPTDEGAKLRRRSSIGCVYSSKGTSDLLPPNKQIQAESTAPRARGLKKEADSTRSISTHNDVSNFMNLVGNTPTATYESGLVSISVQNDSDDSYERKGGANACA